MTAGEITIAKTDPNAELQPGPRRASFDAVLEPDLASENWITVVHSGADAAIIPQEEEGARTWAWLFVIVSSAAIALLLAARLVPVLRARSARAISLSLARSDLSLGNASKAIEALVQQTEVAARQLKGAGPLREVLQAELNLVRERLANIERLAANGELPPDKSALQFRGLVRELERIRRIVDSALASLSGTKKSTTLPRTTSEAYEVLGVNAEVSAGVLKKIVDALRMSWHPDHARDADDRMLREDRIRQINIAWDLINGKREAA